ncbi:MAG TPA: DNA polymerase III subunit delta [candidate division Zixibacteria bacterium]|nr:DNA polymerase III subunit delta [candidate division Zixibacteria bacterium]
MSPIDQAALAKFKRYYLFYGPNTYKLDERVRSLIKAVIEPGSEPFDLDRFDGDRVDFSNVINAASTPPVISQLRVTILTSVDKLSAQSLNRLEPFLSKIPPYSVLAMTAVKLDKRIKIFKRLAAEEKTNTFFFDLFKPAEAADLVVKAAANRGKKLSTYVANAIVETFGTDPYRLENEVEKLSLYVGDKPEIEKSDLAFASGFTHVETAYDLPDLIVAGKPEQAMELARMAIASGISEMQILWILRNYLLRLNAAQATGDAKGLMSAFRMPYGAAQEILRKSKGVSQDAIAKGLTFCFRAEYSLKSARFPSEVVVELLISALSLTFKGNIPKDKLYSL